MTANKSITNYPLAFVTSANKVVHKSKSEVSDDGTPRYVCNPKTPENTYSLADCMKDWKPIYSRLELSGYENGYQELLTSTQIKVAALEKRWLEEKITRLEDYTKQLREVIERYVRICDSRGWQKQKEYLDLAQRAWRLGYN